MLTQKMPWDVAEIRKDFPILHQEINGCPLVYFDNAATTQKPLAVIDAIGHYYRHDNANVHRSVHGLSARATEQFESVRAQAKRFINAVAVQECIFVRGTTEGINLVASSFLEPRIRPGEEILISQLEHHSNIVPWQMVCHRTGAVLKVAPISYEGEIRLDEFEKLLSTNTKFVAISHASNALGTINPVKEMVAMAKAYGAIVLVDGAQAGPHLKIDVQDLGCDFYAFSSHKMYGPTGIGLVWGKMALLEEMRPYQGGGEMISQVTFGATEYAPLPYKFEAGTPNIAGVIGFGAAIDYCMSLDFKAVTAYETALLEHATAAIEAIPGFTIIGRAAAKVPVLSLIHDHIHAHDLGTVLDSEGIAARAGHHCAMPLMDFYDLAATTRLSFSFYNTREEIDHCMRVLAKACEVFA